MAEGEGALHKAIGGRDEEGLLPILYFLNRTIPRCNYNSEMLDMANMVVGETAVR